MNKGGFTQIELQEPLLFHDVEAGADALSRVDEAASLKHAAAARAENKRLKDEAARASKEIARLNAEVAALHAALDTAANARREAERAAQEERIEVSRLRADTHALHAQVHGLQADALLQVCVCVVTTVCSLNMARMHHHHHHHTTTTTTTTLHITLPQDCPESDKLFLRTETMDFSRYFVVAWCHVSLTACCLSHMCIQMSSSDRDQRSAEARR
jgi:cell division septum initiation protein DivIVA